MGGHHSGARAGHRWEALLGSEDLRLADTGGQVGLKNLGNTCFMNTGLQCLCHLDPFVAYFLTGKYREEVNINNPLGSGGSLAAGMAQLQQALWQKSQSQFNPKDLHRVLRKCAPHLFSDYEQQDVQEFLAFCLDGLHEDLNLTSGVRTASVDMEAEDEKLLEGKDEEFAAALAWFRYLQRGKSFLVDLFQGQTCNTLSCMQCGHVKRRFEPFMYLSVPITRGMTRIGHAIQKYLEEETLTGDERWLCPKCDAKVDARKNIFLWKLPPILVLHLKRFEFDMATMGFKKLDVTLTCPVTLDLSSFVTSPQREHATYDVVSVANHHGSFGSGHYTANCRVVAGRTLANTDWYKFDDARVSRLKGDDVISKDAYVIFFVRRAGDGQQIKRQTISMPEVWPHFASDRNSIFQRIGIRGGPRKRTLRGMLPSMPAMRGRSMMRRTRQPESTPQTASAGSGMREALASQIDVPLGLERPPDSSGAKRASIEHKCADDEWDCQINAAPIVKKPIPTSKEPLRPDPTMVANIASMGFARTRVIEALTIAQNDPNKAMSYLTRNPGVVMF